MSDDRNDPSVPRTSKTTWSANPSDPPIYKTQVSSECTVNIGGPSFTPVDSESALTVSEDSTIRQIAAVVVAVTRLVFERKYKPGWITEHKNVKVLEEALEHAYIIVSKD